MTLLKLSVVQASGVGVSIMGMFGLAGFAYDIPSLYTWVSGVAMALPTALSLLMLGISVFLLASCLGAEEG